MNRDMRHWLVYFGHDGLEECLTFDSYKTASEFYFEKNALGVPVGIYEKSYPFRNAFK